MMGGTFSQSDKKFLTDDAQGSIYDFTLAELAAGRASSSALHSYGLQLIADHARLNQRLLSLGRAKGVALPVLISDEDKSKIQTMQGRSGRDLDRALVAEFVKINAQDVIDGRKELATTRDAATRSAVSEFVRTEQKHLNEARRLQRG